MLLPYICPARLLQDMQGHMWQPSYNAIEKISYGVATTLYEEFVPLPCGVYSWAYANVICRHNQSDVKIRH